MSDFNPWADSNGAPYRWGSNFSLGTGDWYAAKKMREEADSIWPRSNSIVGTNYRPGHKPKERKGEVDLSRLGSVVEPNFFKKNNTYHPEFNPEGVFNRDPSIWR